MDEFLEDLKSGEIQVRDRWQFELKSDFHPSPAAFENLYMQEFYFFIPNALQISNDSFSKTDFYKNLTNFVRYKTPELSLKELVDPSCEASPFNRIPELIQSHKKDKIEQELKLIGNIFKSSVRNSVALIIHSKDHQEEKIFSLCSDIQTLRKRFDELSKLIEPEHVNTSYVDEFLSNTIDYYLTGLLNELRKPDCALSRQADNVLCHLILDEQHRISQKRSYRGTAEEILYRSGLLKKYVLDALLLPVNRASIQERYGSLIASLAAGIAMCAYLMLFVWQGSIFVINSLPFLLLTVAAYVLKDRLKEGLKSLSYQRAFYWFSDFETEVRSPTGENILGVMKEFFTFIESNKLPEEIRAMRDRDFHTVLETYKRPEQIIYFKRQVRMFTRHGENKSKLSALNILLRYNIFDFLDKAGDPYHDYLSLDPMTHTLTKTQLPKVYHLNVILKNRYLSTDNSPVSEIKKFRIIVDKNGIRQIEHVH